jgi:hypothetical protein
MNARSKFWCSALLALLAIPATGQRRVVVDSANGPGTDYLDLDPAVVASRSGDVIIVRPGDGSYYTLRRDITHGLRIVAPGPVTPVVSANHYVRIPANELFVIDNIRFGGPRPPYGLSPLRCDGTVLVSRMDGAMSHVSECARIIYTDCHHYSTSIPALIVQSGTTAYVLDSEMLTQYSREFPFWTGGINVRLDSNVWIVNSRVQGGTRGPGTGASGPEPGLDNLGGNSQVFVAGRCSFTGGAAVGLTPRAPGIFQYIDPNLGSPPQPFLVLDPETQCDAPRSTGGYELFREMPVVSPGDAIQGQAHAIEVIGPSNSIVAVFASLLTRWPPIETSMGDLWLRGPVVTLGVGPVDRHRDLHLSTTIPSWLPQGEVLVYQAMSMSPQSLFEIGPPGFAVVQ